MRNLLSYLVPNIKNFILSDGFPCIKHYRNRSAQAFHAQAQRSGVAPPAPEYFAPKPSPLASSLLPPP
jgi:hypothetical protein